MNLENTTLTAFLSMLLGVVLNIISYHAFDQAGLNHACETKLLSIDADCVLQVATSMILFLITFMYYSINFFNFHNTCITFHDSLLKWGSSACSHAHDNNQEIFSSCQREVDLCAQQLSLIMDRCMHGWGQGWITRMCTENAQAFVSKASFARCRLHNLANNYKQSLYRLFDD